MRISNIFYALCIVLGSSNISTPYTVRADDVAIGDAEAGKISTKKKNKSKQRARVSSLKALPAISEIATKKKKGKSSKATLASLLKGPNGLAQSGTPPILADIPSEDLTTLFWREGVIERLTSGSPTQDDCNEFFGSDRSGVSGGMGACFMTQNVGYSFEPVVQAGTSLCYMKGFPTQANFDAGGFSVISGELPDSDPAKIFDVPTGSTSRLVRVEVRDFPEMGEEEGPGDQNIFIRVDSADENQANGNQYHAQLWFCNDGSDTVTGTNDITVKRNGAFIAVDQGIDRGTFRSEVEATLTRRGNEVVFDTSRPRTAAVTYISEDSFNFKANIEITANNLIKNKTYEIFDDQERKGYSIARFSGSGLEDLRFLEGAFTSEETSHNFTAAVEYRDSYYASAGNSELRNQLRSVDIDSNDFYAEAPSANVDLSGLSCDESADVVVQLDFSNEVLQQSVSDCEMRLDGMHFCHDGGELRQAEEAFFQYCNQGPGDGDNGGEGPGEGE